MNNVKVFADKQIDGPAKNYMYILWCLVCASYNLSSFRFVVAKRRQKDDYRIFAPKRRQNDKTKSRQDDKIRAKRGQTTRYLAT
jgi:hypothetical protein